MNDKLSITTEEPSFPKLLGIMVPILLLLTKDNNFKLDIKKLNLDRDFENQVQMMRGIKGYFSEDQQVILSKIQDVFDVLNKVNRIRLDKYDGVIQSQSSLAPIDKREKILAEIGRYSDGKNKELIDKVVDTKRNMFKTKNNIENHRQLVQSQSMSTLESIVLFMNCFKPILRDDMNKKVKKVEKVIEALTIPYENM
ncbi:hypothetical protein GOQ27_12340 [Clostridium sp. D2Q-11]|uniref:Uncharacterized protein n=1 Tax=Anaeromonas frigoriresistens TaxID=2683708 RepID=A0A942Z773_9FIRM|nr:hypothetical protein [Anaeromonas frigoriresistens]MBS4539256.1 hypothetical protein [Anaeromonas frigoriresistens]